MGEESPLEEARLLDQGRGTKRVPEDTRCREEAWSSLLGAGTFSFFVPWYGPGNVIQWGWSKGKTSKIMIKGGARGVIWLVEISPAFGVHNPRKKRGLSSLSFSLSLSHFLSSLLVSHLCLALPRGFVISVSFIFLRRFPLPSPPPRLSSFPLSLTRRTLFISSSFSFVSYIEAHTCACTERLLYSPLSVGPWSTIVSWLWQEHRFSLPPSWLSSLQYSLSSPSSSSLCRLLPFFLSPPARRRRRLLRRVRVHRMSRISTCADGPSYLSEI